MLHWAATQNIYPQLNRWKQYDTNKKHLSYLIVMAFYQINREFLKQFLAYVFRLCLVQRRWRHITKKWRHALIWASENGTCRSHDRGIWIWICCAGAETLIWISIWDIERPWDNETAPCNCRLEAGTIIWTGSTIIFYQVISWKSHLIHYFTVTMTNLSRLRGGPAAPSGRPCIALLTLISLPSSCFPSRRSIASSASLRS